MLGSPNPLPDVRRTACSRTRSSGFTLIELLTVIAIIAILSAITFGIIKGVNENSARAQAQAELSSLSVALEAYKRQYGDYPQTGSGTVTPTSTATSSSVQGLLFNALMGKVGPKLDPIDSKVFVDPGKLSLQSDNLPTRGNTTAVANAFVDPWGRLYTYCYRAKGDTTVWENPSYVLYSTGPDGKETKPGNDGKVDIKDANNLDNLYANQ